ncbi:MAG: hypothetical protein WC164_04080 [Patescibacteria group bacterium]
MEYIRFFFGTPRRLLASLVVIGIILAIIFPNALAEGLQILTYSVLNAIGPMLGSILAVLIVIVGLKIIFSGKK